MNEIQRNNFHHQISTHFSGQRGFPQYRIYKKNVLNFLILPSAWNLGFHAKIFNNFEFFAIET